jgi:hypothetical protein
MAMRPDPGCPKWKRSNAQAWLKTEDEGKHEDHSAQVITRKQQRDELRVRSVHGEREMWVGALHLLRPCGEAPARRVVHRRIEGQRFASAVLVVTGESKVEKACSAGMVVVVVVEE